MNNVTHLNKFSKSNLPNDFQKQSIKFDIDKLRNACNEVLKIKGFDTSLGIPHFAGISLNQIPGDPESIKGNKVRGVYWTKPDATGVEVSRDVKIDESKYTEFVKEFCLHTQNSLDRKLSILKWGSGEKRLFFPPPLFGR